MQPRPAATVMLLRDPYEVLMVRRNPELSFMGGYWVFPGGKLEPGESGEAAARRELAEEAGIALRAGAELILFAHSITPAGLPTRYAAEFFLANEADAERGAVATPDGSEIVETRWIAPREALENLDPIARPTARQLERLGDFTDTASLFREGRGATVTPSVGSLSGPVRRR